MTKYYIWLQMCLGAGSAKVHKVPGKFDSIKDLYNLSDKKRENSGVFSPSELGMMNDTLLEKAQEVINLCAKHDINIITLGEREYPNRLRNTCDPPLVLYYKGEFPNFDDEVAITMVGARRPTLLGIKSALSLSARLSRAGCLVVSGGAYGIDKYSHIGALATGSATVCVLPCGLDIKYLVNNEKMYGDIKKRGCIISEYPPGVGVSRSAFKVRNRIMSALSIGTVIIEAAQASGTIMTANHAAEQGKDVFVIPGPIGEANYAGSNKLISDGARTLLSASDIVSEYAPLYPHKLNLRDINTPFSKETLQVLSAAINGTDVQDKAIAPPEKAQAKGKREMKKDEVSQNAQKVYAVFDAIPIAMDLIVVKSGLDSGEVLACLTELEIFGYITCLPGNRYEIK